MNSADAIQGYMAGVVDGEGSIELRMQKGGTLDLILHVFNSDKPLFEWIEANFGGRTYDIHKRNRIEKPQWAPVYNWNLTGQRARDLLFVLSPYMVIKKAQAELAVEAWDNRGMTPRGGPQHGRAHVSPDLLELRRSYVHRMHALNTKNRGPNSLNT